MKYMGSKNKISKEILKVILKGRCNDQWYVEPFCGGLGTLDKVVGNRIANDKNKYLIAMWKGLQKNRIRPTSVEITKDLYSMARTEFNNGTNLYFDDFLIGWIGWMGSFNGRFFDGGYSGKTDDRDYIEEQIRNTEKQIPLIADVIFTTGDYKDVIIPSNSIIYCDIPYKNTKQYSTSKNFNYDEFWDWCRNKISDGHTVYISEYNAPDDFECVWSKKVTNSLNSFNTYNPVEKLFTINKSLNSSISMIDLFN